MNCFVEVLWDEIVKGYEHEKGQFVVMTDEDFEKARTPATQTIDIRDFVPRAQIDAVFFETPYVLEPSGKGAAKAYALLRDALAKADRLGVGTVVLRQREHLVALEPRDDVLVCTTMRYAHEIRSPRGLEVPKAGSGWDKSPPAPAIPDDVVAQTKIKYREAYERLCDEPFEAWLRRTAS